MDRLSPATWALLGEATAKCEHLAGSAMAPEFARELNQVSLERGAHGTTSIEGNSLSEEDVRAIVQGESRIPPSRAYQKQEIENIVDLFNDIARDCLKNHPAPGLPRDLGRTQRRPPGRAALAASSRASPASSPRLPGCKARAT